MTTRNIDDVRAALFKALDGLADKSLDIERAKAISDVAQTIINSAKVQVDYLRVTGQTGEAKFLEGGELEQLPDGIVSIRRHRLEG
jgi:hypothetical protein